MAVLDTMRTDIMHKAAVTIQRHARGFVVRRQTHRTCRAVVKIQVPVFLYMHAPCCLLMHDDTISCCPLHMRLECTYHHAMVSCSGMNDKILKLFYRL